VPEPVLMELGMYIVESEPLSVAYFIKHSDLSVNPLVARHWRNKNDTVAMNTHETIEEFRITGFLNFVHHPEFQILENIWYLEF
jgi:hypothetical protein